MKFYRVSICYSAEDPYYYATQEVALNAAEDLCLANDGRTILVEEYGARSVPDRIKHRPTHCWMVFRDHHGKTTRQVEG